MSEWIRIRVNDFYKDAIGETKYTYEGLTYRQIAEKKRIGEKNVRESIAGALKKIKNFFD